MAIIVQKFGGTSVGTAEKIKRAALKVKKAIEEGNQVVTVVSAIGKTTDTLIQVANEISKTPDKREMDMLLSTGEQMTMSLFVMALKEMGIKAISLTGWQAGIRTEPVHQNARITRIDTERLKKHLKKHHAIVVAGFQGLSEEGEITTLGRGGSDTTAVALAAALRAKHCTIYTDVTGVFTCDPRVVKTARKLDSISYDEMLELANLGASVLHPRAVEFAKNYNVPLIVRSSTEETEGTIVKEVASMEQNLEVRGLAFENEVTKITIEHLPNKIDTMSNIFTALAEAGIDVDIIIQQMTGLDEMNVSFSVETNKLNDALNVLKEQKGTFQYKEIRHEDKLAKVSIVGSGMVSNPGVAAKMFRTLANENIPIKMVSTSEIKISVVISEEHMVKAVEALHTAFELDSVDAAKLPS